MIDYIDLFDYMPGCPQFRPIDVKCDVLSNHIHILNIDVLTCLKHRINAFVSSSYSLHAESHDR